MGAAGAGALHRVGAVSVPVLDSDPLNVVIVGGGAIGAALLDGLLARPNLGYAAILSRRSRPGGNDPRVAHFHVDAADWGSVTQAAGGVARQVQRVHLLINTAGMLHGPRQQPEKKLADMQQEQLQRSFTINACLLPALAQSFSALLKHDDPAILASLSARVGSIEDNQMGGWYSYRASKAAHNMLLKTLAREWRLSHRNTTVVALHPGTVRSPLSAPFLSPGYRNRVLAPAESAGHLLGVLAGLEPGQSGSFLDWQGEPIPW